MPGQTDRNPRGPSVPLPEDRGLLGDLDAMIVVLDREGIVAHVNRKTCEVLGLPERDLVGGGWFGNIAPEERDAVREMYARIAEGRTEPIPRMENHVLTAGGDRRSIEWSNLYLAGGDGTITGVILSGVDTTQRRKAEKALKESGDLFRQIFLQADDATMILHGDDLSVIDVNPAVLSYGYSREEILEGGVPLLMEKKAFQKWHQALISERDRDLLSIDRISFVKKGGGAVSVSFRGQRIRLPGGEVVYCSFRDITDRILTEEEAKLMQAKLIQGNKMTSLGLMVSSVAHDINNPNNYIMFNSRIISDFIHDALPILENYCRENEGVAIGGLSPDELTETLPKLLDGISDGTKMITRIVNDLKDFVRQNLQTLDHDVDVNEVVARSSSLIENHIRKFTEKFRVELTESLPSIRGSKQQLVQVLVNIILNALESLPDKKHGVQVATRTGGDGDHVEISVTDEGCGMPEEVLERALEPFFSTRLDKGGTGLGLTICNSIIKEHEGRMEIRSSEDRGTTITLILPTEESRRRSMH